ncbi:hypothetical protein CDL12_07826 [Handroanthus impetiginosus]|uniref:Pre-rRNA-processing protein TSR2 n=1 Tax=Handroanthus impetiginosus TaxID=429701 RepID=A0A2G9HPQ4_9LAMI|nr:hypothetical protein CDL12_07826 [Handroanthus impetiginosus]
MNPALTPEAAAQLQEGINLVLDRWAALRMAVENEWGGRDTLQKSQQFGVQLFCCLTQSREQVYIDDVEDMLDEFMLSLNAEIDDGSIEEFILQAMIFIVIYKYYYFCVPKNVFTFPRCVGPWLRLLLSLLLLLLLLLLLFCSLPLSSLYLVDAPQCQSNLNQNGTVTNEPSHTQAPEVADGWTMVASRRNRGRRN